jgi:Protein of unknown function (DUF2795)
MERGSSKHGVHLDEQMARETSGLVQGGHSPRAGEWHEPEPSAEGQPEATVAPEGAGGAPPGMDAADVAGRSRLARYLSPSAFPGDRDRLIANAIGNRAPDDVLDDLRVLPEGRSFVNVTEVWSALGRGTERDDRRF